MTALLQSAPPIWDSAGNAALPKIAFTTSWPLPVLQALKCKKSVKFGEPQFFDCVKQYRASLPGRKGSVPSAENERVCRVLIDIPMKPTVKWKHCNHLLKEKGRFL